MNAKHRSMWVWMRLLVAFVGAIVCLVCSHPAFAQASSSITSFSAIPNPNATSVDEINFDYSDSLNPGPGTYKIYLSLIVDIPLGGGKYKHDIVWGATVIQSGPTNATGQYSDEFDALNAIDPSHASGTWLYHYSVSNSVFNASGTLVYSYWIC